jgi:uncharacterized protein
LSATVAAEIEMAKTDEFIKACHQGRLADAKALLPNSDVNGANDVRQGALLTFHPEITRFLLENGADPDRQTNENGSSVLAGLCYVRRLECVRLLLARGADPNLGRVESGETPLHHVLASGMGNANDQLRIVVCLLEAGANPNQAAGVGVLSFNFMRDVRVRGETPLHRAAAHASIEIIDALLAAGADRTIQDAHGDSPLTWAGMHWRDHEIMKRLCFGDYKLI